VFLAGIICGDLCDQCVTRFVVGAPQTLATTDDCKASFLKSHRPSQQGPKSALLRPDLLTKRSPRTAYGKDPALTAVRTACCLGPPVSQAIVYRILWLLHHVRAVGWAFVCFVDLVPRNDSGSRQLFPFVCLRLYPQCFRLVSCLSAKVVINNYIVE
jgi:hypothetical protein